jgi:predicted RNA-binding protein with PIN domain
VPVPVIVDGYNLLYARGEAPAVESRDRLVTELVRWARGRGRKVVLVFDAQKGGTREAREVTHGPVTVHFTRAGELADAFIVRWVTAHPEAVVVSSDREVQRGAARRGAAVLDAESFAARLGGDGDDDSSAPASRRRGPRGRGPQAAWLRGL